MTCRSCGKLNLSGGVRCAYCGHAFPPAVDFDLGEDTTSVPPLDEPDLPSSARSSCGGAGLLGAIAFLLLKGKSLLALLKLGKFATTLSSMFVFIWADALLFGWKFGAGIAVCILIHELGHVFVNWRKGLKQSAPVFIPFVGAVIFLKHFKNDPLIQAESGAGGPAAGLLAALGCLALGRWTGNSFWFALAHVGAIINLYNLIPFGGLDGSHIGQAFSNRTWDVLLVLLLLVAVKLPGGALWLLLLAGFVLRLNRHDSGQHFLVRPSARVRMMAVYLGLSIGLAAVAMRTSQLRAADALREALDRPAASAQASEPEPAETQPPPPSEAERREMEAAARSIVQVVRILVLAAAFGGWLLVAFFLAKAAEEGFHASTFAMAGACAGALLAISAAARFLDVDPPVWLAWVGAYFGALAAALVYAVYHARRKAPGQTPPSLAQLRYGCAARSGAAALLVAYATNRWELFALAAVAGSLVLVARLWVREWVASSARFAAGSFEIALENLRCATDACPDLATKARFQLSVARTETELGRGGPALEALESLDRLPREQTSAVHAFETLQLRARALLLQDRYEEALGACEALLSIPLSHPDETPRPVAVHAILADASRFRDWPDDSLAQAEIALRTTSERQVLERGNLHRLRAEALAKLGRTDEAFRAQSSAFRSSHAPIAYALASATAARIGLIAGDLSGAEAHLIRAEAQTTGILETAFVRTLLLARKQGLEAARGEAERLASRWPGEHWSRQAMAATSAAA